jgi:hypothetical protein
VPTAQGHQYRDGTKSNSAYRVAEGHLTGSGDLGLPSKKGALHSESTATRCLALIAQIIRSRKKLSEPEEIQQAAA